MPAMPAAATDSSFGGPWIEQGPRPLTNAPTVRTGPGGAEDDFASGAIEAIAASPTDADLVYVATTSGGVWRTRNATDRRPLWEPLTEDLPSTSIGALTMSPLDERIIYAGTGDYSSARAEGLATGLYRSVDGGDSWEILGQQIFARLNPDPGDDRRREGMRIRNVVTTDDQTIFVTADHDTDLRHLEPDLRDKLGLWRFDTTGGGWTQVSGAPGTGLPLGGVSHVVLDPRDPSRQTLYAAVPTAGVLGRGTIVADPGVYRSVDGGDTWQLLFEVPNGPGIPQVLRIEVAVSPVARGPLYVFSVAYPVDQFELVGLYSIDESGAATSIAFPNHVLDAQGMVHGSIRADRTQRKVFYLGGRQEIYRVDMTEKRMADRWMSLRSGSAPHHDSRDIVFDADGDILQADDGGLYRLRTAWLPGRIHWRAVSAEIGATEAYSVAYDPLNAVIAAGLQDNGVVVSEPIDPHTATPGSIEWREIGIDGDGLQQGAVVEEAAPPTGRRTAVRYHSNQNWLYRYRYDERNRELSADAVLHGVERLAVNAVLPERVVASAPPGLHESADRLDHTVDVLPSSLASSEVTSLLYGGRRDGVANPDLLYVGVKDALWVRTGPDDPTDPDRGFERVAEYPGGAPVDLAIDPEDHDRVFVVGRSNRVWARQADGSYADLTGDLDGVGGGYAGPNSVAFIDVGGGDLLVVGGPTGVFATELDDCRIDTGCTWQRFGTGLPNVQVADLAYEPSVDLLILGSFGRGVWAMANVSTTVHELPAPALIQSRYGDPGNFELAHPGSVNGIAHQYRDNEAALPWQPSYAFGQGLGAVDAISMIQSDYDDPGNLEIVARAEDRLYALWRDSGSPFLWHGPEPLAVPDGPIDDAAGNVALIQSSFGDVGNFEVVYPSTAGGFVHLYRDNDAGGDQPPWFRTGTVAESLGRLDGLTMIQSSYVAPGAVDGNLEVVARVGTELHHLWRGEDLVWSYHGLVADDAGGDPVLIQGSYGDIGNFELIYPSTAAGFVHLYRDNDAGGDDPPWIRSGTFADELGRLDGVAMMQSTLVAPGDTEGRLEVVARVDNEFHHLWRGEAPVWHLDGEVPPTSATLPSVSISNDQEVQEGASGRRRLDFTVTLDRPSPVPVFVPYATNDGTATAPDDYEQRSGVLRFDPGERTQTVTVFVRGETAQELSSETFTIDLAPGTYHLARPTATVTILDDTPTISVQDAFADEAGTGFRTTEFVVELDHPSTRWVAVDYATADGTAVANADYRSVQGTVRFPPGETTQIVPVRVRGDTVQEENETFELRLSKPRRADLGTGFGTATILDDNARVRIVDIDTGEPAISVDEPASGGVWVELWVGLEHPSDQWVSVPYSTEDGTAVAGTDYVPRSGTVLFAPGESWKEITVRVRSDDEPEGDEQFTVELTAPANGILTGPSATVTIVGQ